VVEGSWTWNAICWMSPSWTGFGRRVSSHRPSVTPNQERVLQSIEAFDAAINRPNVIAALEGYTVTSLGFSAMKATAAVNAIVAKLDTFPIVRFTMPGSAKSEAKVPKGDATEYKAATVQQHAAFAEGALGRGDEELFHHVGAFSNPLFQDDRGDKYLQFRIWKDRMMTGNSGLSPDEMPKYGALNVNWESNYSAQWRRDSSSQHASDGAVGAVSLVGSAGFTSSLALTELAVDVGAGVDGVAVLDDAGHEHAVDAAVAAVVEPVTDQEPVALARREHNDTRAAPAGELGLAGEAERIRSSSTPSDVGPDRRRRPARTLQSAPGSVGLSAMPITMRRPLDAVVQRSSAMLVRASRSSGRAHSITPALGEESNRKITQAHESDGHDVDQGVQRSEVVGIPRVERQLERASDCSDHQVDRSCASRLAARCPDCRIDTPVGPSRISVERQRGEGRLGPLQTILPSCSLHRILGSVGASSEFGHRDRRHGDLGREHTHIDAVEVDHDGRVEHAALVSHAVGCFDRRRCRGRVGTVRRRWAELPGRSVRWMPQARSEDAAAG
jgi:hypothetical protein